LDFDSISFAVSGFVGSATVAALVALVDAGASDAGSDVLTAYCLGWEVAAALGRGVNPTHYAKGWHPTATLGLFAATAACCRLLGLSSERTAAALSVAVSEASGVKTMIGNMLNPYHVGTAARNGIMAARLAAAGFAGNPVAFEATQGFLNLFNGPGKFDAERIVTGLGTAWDLADPGPVVKIYPCCGLVHSALDALLGLRQQHCLSASDVRAVIVRVHEYVPQVMHVSVPDSGYGAKFSIPYCAAAAIVDGCCGLATFDAVRLDLVEWSSRVTVEVHPELRDGSSFFSQEFTEVALETSAGMLVRRVNRMDNRGTAANLATADVREKLADCFWHGNVTGDAASAWDAVLGADSSASFRFWELIGGGNE
jgi:2-methylcitrate dehydratase PrpD